MEIALIIDLGERGNHRDEQHQAVLPAWRQHGGLAAYRLPVHTELGMKERTLTDRAVDQVGVIVAAEREQAGFNRQLSRIGGDGGVYWVVVTAPDAPTGLDDLWREHARRLLAYATYLVGPHDAHDIVVDAFLLAAPRIEAGAVADPGAYLIRAVRNRANGQRRSQVRQWRRDLAAVGPATTALPESDADLRRAVERLSVAQRSVIFLVYWEDRSEAEVARMLDISPSTVHRHLTRARSHLRKALG